jgi:phage host-nuclease inhibitor protein Gam
MFGYLTSLFTTPQKPELNQFLKMLWLSHRVDWVMSLIGQVESIEVNVPVLFLQQLTEANVTKYTSEIVKQILIKYPKPENGVCLEVSKMIKEDTFIGGSCAHAIGNEKNTYNKEFYHKIRVLKSLEIGPWRKFLQSVKAKLDELRPNLETKTIEYTLGLFNEPLNFTVKNTSSTQDILSLYNGRMFKNKVLRTVIEVPLDGALKQCHFHNFAEHMGDEPLVIITKHVDVDVKPPKNMYVVFLESTKSFGERILPFAEIISTYNVLDHL